MALHWDGVPVPPLAPLPPGSPVAPWALPTAASLSPAQARAARSRSPCRGDAEGGDVPKGHGAARSQVRLRVPGECMLCPEVSHTPGEEAEGGAENCLTRCSPAPCPVAVPRPPAPHTTGSPGCPPVQWGLSPAPQHPTPLEGGETCRAPRSVVGYDGFPSYPRSHNFPRRAGRAGA